VDQAERSSLEREYIEAKRPWPMAPGEWEAAAEAVLPKQAFDYLAGGAGTEQTMRANLEAFYAWRLVPRMLTGTTERQMSVDLFGASSPVPFFLAPVGVQKLFHPDGERAVARAAKGSGIPMVLSSAADTSMEDIAEELGDSPRWFQLYWVNDREIASSMVKRAEAAGYTAIVLTVDTLTLGYRDRDLRNLGFLPFGVGDGLAQFTSDPVFRSRLEKTPEEDLEAAAIQWLSLFPNLGLSWSDLEWLRDQTSLPVLLKGILSGGDARRAADHGCDGVIVSNHGGRQVDGEIAALDALPDVRAAVGDDYPVLMDSGIRRASDIIKALALGADAVLLGRPYAYGLAVGGQAGVERVLQQMILELDTTMALLGAASIDELDRGFVARGPDN
jgi:lactate 2-monooxygenase